MTDTAQREPLIPWPEEEPVIALWPTAALPFGIKRARAYLMANAGTFPVRPLRVGGRWCVRTSDLRRELGLPLSRPEADHASPDNPAA
jgi:hypothetical protein